MTSYPSVLTFTKGQMVDTYGTVDTGTALLALWSAKHLVWTNVAVSKDETNFALVQKDSDEARGKRLCVTGSIVQIAVEKTDEGKVFNGLLGDYQSHLYHFSAVGSSGTLVERSQARLCGFVTGKYDYPNSGGGTGHAVKLVGMFDLPENRQAPVPAP